jgi:hypothetical protein
MAGAVRMFLACASALRYANTPAGGVHQGYLLEPIPCSMSRGPDDGAVSAYGASWHGRSQVVVSWSLTVRVTV